MKNTKGAQSGMALITSLVLVSLSIMVGVSAFQSAHIEEAASGGQRSAASALMAAEFGASEKIQEFTASDLTSMSLCGGAESYSTFNSVNNSQNDTSGYYFYWCKSASDDSVILKVKGESGGVNRYVQAVYVLPDGFVLPPINLPANIDSFEAPTSGSLIVEGLSNPSVDGGYYPAITTNGQQAMVESEISDNNMDNYFGGISDTVGDSILNDPNLFYIFVSMLKQYAIDQGNSVGVVDNSTDLGDIDNPQITYATGADVNGNNSGAGILLVEGDYGTSGTPNFDGLVIVLGNNFDLTGGGRGGVDGSVIVAPMTLDDSHVFIDSDSDGLPDTIHDSDGNVVNMSYGDIAITSNGGGNAAFSHNQPYLDMAFDLMPTNAQEFWQFNNISPYSEPRLSHWTEVNADGV